MIRPLRVTLFAIIPFNRRVSSTFHSGHAFRIIDREGHPLTQRILRTLVLLGVAVSFSFAGTIEFSGTPARKVEIDEKGQTEYKVPKADQGKYQTVITKDGENYFWTSRGSVPLVKTESGSFITFVAVNGSGYIRTMEPAVRRLYSEMSDKEKLDAGYLYMEHLTLRLGSITYFGF